MATRYILTNGVMIIKTGSNGFDNYKIMGDSMGKRIINEDAREYAAWLSFKTPNEIGLTIVKVCQSMAEAMKTAYSRRYSI